jgi:predicted AAA+ superfamily ATPase
MIPRTLEETLRSRATMYPVVTLTGPRQSGKTTLVRATFPEHAYRSLEDPDERDYALRDPRGFLRQFSSGVILDEVQRCPDLPSYIQGMVDQHPNPGRFILTGSQNLLLLERVSQSLAGRTAVLNLLPFSAAELAGRSATPPEALGRLPARVGEASAGPSGDLMVFLRTGFYPRIHDQGMEPEVWLADYVRTYVERDVREVLSVGNLEAFSRFLRLCAGRSGQILNISGLAADAGISHTTARRWLSVLEASFLVVLLRPHFRSFNKRLIKSPKLYLTDTGLLCYLFRIRSAEELRTHFARGPVFESFVVMELLKSSLHCGEEPALHYWRDSQGHEIDVLIDLGQTQLPVEVKSGETVVGDSLSGLRYWRKLTGNEEAPAALVYGGERSFERDGAAVWSWRDL